MNKIDCPNFEDCSAPICPRDESSIESGIWYPDEEICTRRGSQTLDWIRKQKAIAKAKALDDRYFTMQMLQSIKQVRKGIEGISPDQPLEQARDAERKWIVEKEGGRVIAKQNQEPQGVVAKKKDNLPGATSTSHQREGGKNDV